MGLKAPRVEHWLLHSELRMERGNKTKLFIYHSLLRASVPFTKAKRQFRMDNGEVSY